MALSPNELIRNGFVVDAATGALVTTTNTAGATLARAYLRDPDGRLVVRG